MITGQLKGVLINGYGIVKIMLSQNISLFLELELKRKLYFAVVEVNQEEKIIWFYYTVKIKWISTCTR